jgi:hypothetical protein
MTGESYITKSLNREGLAVREIYCGFSVHFLSLSIKITEWDLEILYYRSFRILMLHNSSLNDSYYRTSQKHIHISNVNNAYINRDRIVIVSHLKS